MTNFAHQNSEIENVEIAKETEIDTKTTECPTYQNTSLLSGMILFYSCNNITTTLIQIPRLFYFGFFSKPNHQMII